MFSWFVTHLKSPYLLFISLPKSPFSDKGELLDDDDVLSLTSSDPAASALLAASPREQEMVFEEEAGEPAETSKPPCPAYAELLEVMERASGRLQLPWERVKKGVARRRLEERFLSGHNKAAPAVVGKFREAKARSAAFKTCILLRSVPGPRQTGGPGPSRFEDRRQGQRSSVASWAPPPPPSKSQRRRDSRKKKQDLRKVINHSSVSD
ncbi:hypothetical protein DPX16_4016 [Anabarilius grahami]|uniref:Uncharacterized protein n=1 Tax=Anabarilius grahami TaxID=495550 RepID=A0A3N0Y0G2_ANAGA|nr:hypothetical protein DPX16_4016 [Anabarilius grahami]